ncbi:MAG: cation-translocating P-type ATPase [Chthoniobacteraceae bacterium]
MATNSAEPAEKSALGEVEGWKGMAVRSGACLVCTVVALVLRKSHPDFSMASVVGAYLAGGWDLTAKVWEGIREREFGTDFLMWLVAFGAMFIGEQAEAAVLLFLFSASGAMERFAHGRTQSEISALLKNAPKLARLVENGVEREVPVVELRPGQHVRVTANEQVPVDILVEKGESACDEAMLTGEAEPIPKIPGDTGLAGTLNLWGVIEGRVLRPAEDSALQRIIRLIENAQHLKAPVQRFTDRFGTRYTAIVLSVCTAVFFVWWLVFGSPPFLRDGAHESAFYRAMTLLVVMSPCALVLSVPSAILSAIAFGARNGVLFRGGAAIENLAGITAVAMDKTGTLTRGKLELIGVDAIAGTEDEIVAAAGNLARISNHPMSRSISREADRRHVAVEQPEETETISGEGLSGKWRGEKFVLGNRSLVASVQPGVTLPPPAADASEVWIASAKLLGRLLLRDQLRPEAPELISRLHAAGLKTVMLTGDKTGAAEQMGRMAGVQEILSQLKPAQKVEALERMKKAGDSVAMIGDGVNDAPCLAAADIGVAMGARGSDAAIEQAEVVLMNDKLENFLLALKLSVRARRIIRQNLTLALGVIMVMSLTALFAKALPLYVGVLAHEGSTVIVVLNSLRLLFTPRNGAATESPARPPAH